MSATKSSARNCGQAGGTGDPISKLLQKQKIRVNPREFAFIRVPLPVGRMREVFCPLAEARSAQSVFVDLCYGSRGAPLFQIRDAMNFYQPQMHTD